MDNKELEMAKEIEKIAMENNISIHELIEQYKKAQSLATKQGKEQTKTFNDILTDKVDIDNGYIYEIETGETIGEL